MKTCQLLLIIFIVLLSFSIHAEDANEVADADSPRWISLIRLVAVPEQYDKRTVRVAGFFHLEFEGNLLYLHKEDYERSLVHNAVVLDLPRGEGFEKYEGQYVTLEGVFERCDDSRYSCKSSGMLHQIRSIVVVRPRRPG